MSETTEMKICKKKKKKRKKKEENTDPQSTIPNTCSLANLEENPNKSEISDWYNYINLVVNKPRKIHYMFGFNCLSDFRFLNILLIGSKLNYVLQ